MEHIVQFAIGVDDDAIVRRVMDNAEKVITDQLYKETKKQMFETDRWYDNRVSGVQPWVQARFDEFLENNKDLIIKLASDKLADKLSRTKAVKEAAANAVKGE